MSDTRVRRSGMHRAAGAKHVASRSQAASLRPYRPAARHVRSPSVPAQLVVVTPSRFTVRRVLGKAGMGIFWLVLLLLVTSVVSLALLDLMRSAGTMG